MLMDLRETDEREKLVEIAKLAETKKLVICFWIRGLIEKRMTFRDIHVTTTTLELKVMITEIIPQLPINEMMLFFGGKLMQNHRQLVYYDIGDHSALKLRGGSPKKKKAGTSDTRIQADDPELIKQILGNKMESFEDYLMSMNDADFKTFYEFSIKQKNFDRVINFVIENNTALNALEDPLV